jgi:hypothetical protein
MVAGLKKEKLCGDGPHSLRGTQQGKLSLS